MHLWNSVVKVYYDYGEQFGVAVVYIVTEISMIIQSVIDIDTYQHIMRLCCRIKVRIKVLAYMHMKSAMILYY